MARRTKQSDKENDRNDLDMEKFMEDIANNTPNGDQFKEEKKDD